MKQNRGPPAPASDVFMECVNGRGPISIAPASRSLEGGAAAAGTAPRPITTAVIAATNRASRRIVPLLGALPG